MDNTEFGKPKYFDVELFAKSVEQLIKSDEVILALKMLEMLPSYYRKNIPDRIKTLKNQIYENTWSLHDYCHDQTEIYDNAIKNQNIIYPHRKWNNLAEIFDTPFTHPRSSVILELVTKFNEQGISPNICELGPANFWLPYGLESKGLKFKYNGNSIQYQSQLDHSGRLKHLWYDTLDEKTDIFICFEVIEHLWNEAEILHFYKRKKLDAQFVLLSTPLNTLEGGRADALQEISHLRTYNEDDFLKVASNLFIDRSWTLYRSQLMVLVGQINK